MSLINLYSNIWFLFINNSNTDYMLKSRIIQTHGISEELCIDTLTKFWSNSDKSETYTNEIAMNIIKQKQNKLILFWDALAKRINTNIINGAEPLLIYSSVSTARECLIAFYLYFLKKYANIPLNKSANMLASKISSIQYTMSDKMKKIIYLYCA